MNDPIVYLNGQLTPLSEAKIPVLDRGFIFGDGIYEVIPMYDGKPFRGEQQRLAFARVFLTRPDMLFLDEASSAMDGETEELLYAKLQEELPQAAIISIAHRETVARYHQQRWHFSRSGSEQTSSLRIAAI